MRSNALGAAASAAALAGVGYLAYALGRVRDFRKRPLELARHSPSIAVLKPLHGVDESLEENLVSFCTQEYPAFEVIFGVHDARDPAATVAQRVVARYPERARLVVGDGRGSRGNPKVANLVRMCEGIWQEVVVVADADMRASPDYLAAIVAPLGEQRVGAVTCLYSGDAGPGLISQLAAMFVNEQFAPSVLVANSVEPLNYAFGATIAIRRTVLQRIGGFEALRNHVADDYLLGRLVTQLGLEVRLSRYVIENVMREPSLQSMWSRELRWSRTIRSVRPAGHALSVVTFGLPLAMLAAVLAPGRRSSMLLGLAAMLRIALRREAHAAFGVHPKAASALLIPLRDALSLAVWAAAFFDRDVEWRGQQLHLDPEGQILPA